MWDITTENNNIFYVFQFQYKHFSAYVKMFEISFIYRWYLTTLQLYIGTLFKMPLFFLLFSLIKDLGKIPSLVPTWNIATIKNTLSQEVVNF